MTDAERVGKQSSVIAISVGPRRVVVAQSAFGNFLHDDRVAGSVGREGSASDVPSWGCFVTSVCTGSGDRAFSSSASHVFTAANVGGLYEASLQSLE